MLGGTSSAIVLFFLALASLSLDEMLHRMLRPSSEDVDAVHDHDYRDVIVVHGHKTLKIRPFHEY